MFSSQLQPTPGNGEGQIDVSLIGRTNKLHSEEEQLYIRNVLLAAKSQSGTVDGDLRRKEDSVVDLIGRCNIALAPHKRLPPDVLRSIFHFCAEEGGHFPLLSKHLVPCLLHITHVCSAWRQLALETPALWSHISIYLSDLSDAHRSRHHRALSSARQWFDRAQDMRRSLFITFAGVNDLYISPHLDDSWEKLLEFMAQYNRLEELELKYPINYVALKLPDHVWPSIERLHLEIEDDGPSAGRQLFSNFGKLSNLRHLHIYGSKHLGGMDRVPWHQLRTLEIGGFCGCPLTPSSCLDVLRQSPLLEHCRVRLWGESSPKSTLISKEIVLANMDYFDATFLDGSAVPMFTQQLAIPNVTTFILRTISIEGWTQLNCDTPALIGIIQRSGGMRRIRCLKIGTSSAVLDTGVLLELLPSLDSISIKSGHLSDNSIKRLSSGELGPKLCKIYSRVLHDADQILSMVESRYQNATRSLDSEQIEDRPCPFKSISISCTVTEKRSLHHDKIKLLSEKCGVNIYLNIGEVKNFEDEYT